MKPYVTEDNLPEKTALWLEKIAPFNTHQMTLDIEHAALLVIDMQKFFLDPESKTFTSGGPPILPNIKKLIEAFRAADSPVIFTKHVHHADGIDAGIMAWWWEGMCIEGSRESEVSEEIAPLPHEKQVLKHRYSSFYNTDLETILRCQHIRDVVICGIMTNMCCETTARDAYQRDYRVFFPADATGSIVEEMHVASLLNLALGFAYVNTTDEIVSQIQNS